MQRPLLRRGTAEAFLLTSVVLLLSGCAANSAYLGSGHIDSRALGLTLSVVNRNVEDVRVYIIKETTTMPIGTVGSMNSRSFKIPHARLGTSRVLRLAVVASPSHAQYTMTPLEFEPGQTVEARIGTFLQHSLLHVYPVPFDF